jgi:hypothetical protein
MDALRREFWSAISALFPKEASATQLDSGVMVITYPMPTETRPNRLSHEVSVVFEQRAVSEMAASEPADRGRLASNAAKSVQRQLKTYDPYDEGPKPFLIIVDEVSMGR